MKKQQNIIKKAQVRMRAPYSLGDGTETPGGTGARIVVQDESMVIIEVVCSCGRTTQVRCNYDGSASVAAPKPAASQQAEGTFKETGR